MTDYCHHVPGRLRIRAKALRADSSARAHLLRTLHATDGITRVRLNAKACSVTLQYDPQKVKLQSLMGVLEASDCLSHAVTLSPQPARAPSKPWNLPKEAAKIAFNVLVSRGVSASLTTLLKVRA
ncbi:MAG TPA: hypothetical protein DD979_18185 [Gammaproteobacteria bacterium]|nr:hypothetical protein [Gammaproteobacteria bacterium]